MGRVLTDKEALQALLDGKKLTTITYGPTGQYIYLDDLGNLKDERGYKRNYNSLLRYKIWEPPKQKKKVTLYRYTYKSSIGDVIYQSEWMSAEHEDHRHLGILKIETKEVEYEESI